jgi:hypothetical protein
MCSSGQSSTHEPSRLVQNNELFMLSLPTRIQISFWCIIHHRIIELESKMFSLYRRLVFYKATFGCSTCVCVVLRQCHHLAWQTTIIKLSKSTECLKCLAAKICEACCHIRVTACTQNVWEQRAEETFGHKKDETTDDWRKLRTLHQILLGWWNQECWDWWNI